MQVFKKYGFALSRSFLFCVEFVLSKDGFCAKIVNMAKRATGVGKMRTSRSKKTKKRLVIKREMLAKKAAKKRGKRRK